jgi:hypothetical protein
MFHVPLLHVKFSNGMGFYKNGMLAEVENFVFKKPNGILHFARHFLDTLKKSKEAFISVVCVHDLGFTLCV